MMVKVPFVWPTYQSSHWKKLQLLSTSCHKLQQNQFEIIFHGDFADKKIYALLPTLSDFLKLSFSQHLLGLDHWVTKKLTQEFSRTESRILGSLSKLDEFLLNPQIRTHSGTVPGTFRNTNVENQESNQDRSQEDPHPEVGPSVYQSRHSIDSDPDEAPHIDPPITKCLVTNLIQIEVLIRNTC